MATLRIMWDNGEYHQLSATDQGSFHQAAVVRHRIRTNILAVDLGPIGDAPTNKVIAKIARGERENDFLHHEYQMYDGRLKVLQGSVVPRCYGFFTGRVDGQKFGCLLLEHIKPHTNNVVDADEFHRQFMCALSKLHEAGVKHGNMSTSHILQMGFSPRIIDFSMSEKHRCKQGHPLMVTGGPQQITIDSSVSCKELSKMEIFHATDPDGLIAKVRSNHRHVALTTLSGGSPIHVSKKAPQPFPPPMRIPPRTHQHPQVYSGDARPVYGANSANFPPPMPLPPRPQHSPYHGNPRDHRSVEDSYPPLERRDSPGPHSQPSNRTFAGHRPVIPSPLNLSRGASPVVPSRSQPLHDYPTPYSQGHIPSKGSLYVARVREMGEARQREGLGPVGRPSFLEEGEELDLKNPQTWARAGYSTPPPAQTPQRTYGPVGYTIYR